MHILVSSVGRDSHPSGICRVAANHVRAMLSGRIASRVVLAIGKWQSRLFRSMLGSDASNVEFIEIDIANNSFQRNMWYANALPELAKSKSVDLVHLAYPAPTLRRRFPCPVVVTLHDLYPFDIPENFGFPRYLGNKLILRQCLSSIDGIVCVSDATRSRLQALFPVVSEKIPVVVAGNYVHMSFGDTTPPALISRLSQKSFLLTVAQHRKNKNLDILVKSYATLLKSGRFAGSLIIVGADGPETASLHALSKSLGLDGLVIFTCSISDGELRWLYLNCALFVVSSSVEGYCLPIAEAKSANAKIVCSDIAALRETGGDWCTYFSLAGDAVKSLVDAMSAALSRSHEAPGEQAERHDSVVLAEYSRFYSRLIFRT